MGSDSQAMISAMGNRKNRPPRMSIQARPRWLRRLFRMSMRTWSFRSRAKPAQSRNTAEKRYHCISRYAFEL